MPVAAQQLKPNLAAAMAHRMNYLVARQSVVAGNVANSETPAYKAKDVEFHSLFSKNMMGMAATNTKHLKPVGESGAGRLSESDAFTVLDGNSVQLDQEMLKLNEIQLNYRLATQLYAKQAQFQKIAIGRGQ